MHYRKCSLQSTCAIMGERSYVHVWNQPLNLVKKAKVPKWILQKDYEVHFFLKYRHWYLTFLQWSKRLFSFSSSKWDVKVSPSHTPLLVTEVEKSALYIREKGQGPVRRMFANSTEQERLQLMRPASNNSHCHISLQKHDIATSVTAVDNSECESNINAKKVF